MIKKKKVVKIMIAEDHILMAQKIADELTRLRKHFRVTGIAKHGKELIAMIKASPPDIVLLDLGMPVMDGHEVLKIFRSDFPDIKAIVISQYYDNFYIANAIIDGARAYLKKNSDQHEIISAIEKVMADGFYFDDQVSRDIISVLNREKNKKNYLVNDKIFTEKEIEILNEICSGKTIAQIADNLNITVHTIDYHKRNLLAKTESKSVISLVTYAIKHSLVKL